MIAAFLAWWRNLPSGGLAYPGLEAMHDAIEREARTERATTLEWVIDVIPGGEHPMTVQPSAKWVGWNLDRVEVEAAGVFPMSDSRYLRWGLFRLHLSRVAP